MELIWLLAFCFSSVFCFQIGENDGGTAPRVPMNDGNSIPTLGLGTFLGFDESGQKEVKEKEVENQVTWALDAGYRLIDTASAYHTESQIGVAIKKSSIPRENIFLVTKLASHEQRNVVESLRQSLSRLNMTYVDLYLIHTPVTFKEDFSSFDDIDYLDTWKGMEEAQRLGLTKSIGISNFNIDQIKRLLENCNVKPAVLQVEVNLNLAQDKLLDFCKSNGIVVMAYTPLGSLFDSSGKPPPPRHDDTALVTIAEKYGKTTPQIVLRYLTQRGVIPIPKSVNKKRIEENINIFDFQLSAEDMEILAKFNADYRTVFPSFWQEHPYYPFEKKDVPDPDPFKGKPIG
ncbi:aldo-keto reductase AKR2E4-like [Amyelois transitella]|uniref:aldo-keto reductase AKR2E4-like n=1 Tax=Amyelois transitella TaxID=680683 RepID=UPI002990161D|nr:aldo-keto reductase AKR2E4-like [Amyelois transitella]